MTWRRAVESMILLGAFWMLLPVNDAGAEEASPATKLTIAQTTVRMDIKKAGFTDTRATPGMANGSLLVSNQGTAPAEQISVTGFYTDGTSVPLIARTDSGGPSIALQPNETVLIHISFLWNPEHSDNGWLAISDDTRSGPPATVPFQIRELVPGWVFVRVLLFSLLGALLVCLVVNRILQVFPPANVTSITWSSTIYPGSTWTFKDSWASNLTALGAIVGTALAASGFLSDVLPGLSTGMFVGYGLVYGSLVLLAPVIYTALYDKEGKPTYGGVLVAGGLTVWATIGELITVAQLVARGGLPSTWGYVAVIAGVILFAVMVAYMRASIAPLLKSPAPAPAPAGAPAPAPAAIL